MTSQQLPRPKEADDIRRIVSVCPSNTDLCAHLGVLDRVVARDSWSDWPEPHVSSIETIGLVLNLKFDRIVELQPDLILASLNVPGMEKVVPKLKATGLPIVIYDPECWQDVLDNLLDLGKRLGIPEKAKEVVQEAEENVKRLQADTKDMPLVSLCVEFWPKPVFVPCGKSYINQVLSWVRVENPFAHYVEHRSGQPPHDEILEADPDMYSVSWCGTPWNKYSLESVIKRYKGTGIQIDVDHNRIFKLWEGEIGHPSLRLVDAAKRILEQGRMLNI